MKIILLYLLLIITTGSAAQTTFIQNVNEGIASGSITVTAPPFDMGTIYDIFDGDINSLARTPNINPAIITLEFENPFLFSASKFYMITDGKWKLECALTLTDLNNQTGSYHLLTSNNNVLNSVWDTIGFTPVGAKVIRLTAKRTSCCDGYVHINEWMLYTTPEITKLCFTPASVKLLPATSFKMQLYGSDAYGNEYALSNTSAGWSSSNISVATVTSVGTINGISLGNSTIGVQWNALHYSLSAFVSNSFSAIPAPKRIVKTAIIIQDPVIAAAGDQRLHSLFGWNDPYQLYQQVADTLEAISNHTIEYEFVAVYDDNSLQTRMQGTLLSADSMYQLLTEPGWVTLSTNGTMIDYNLMLDTYNLCEQSNNGTIDEVWLMGFPYAGYYESELAGENAFWYNSPPLNYGNSCAGLLPIMGYNFERDWPEAVHSYGHRVESTMSQVYGGWTYDGSPANNWELFASINIHNIGKSYIGNIHFPPNGESDYDYGNTTFVANYAENFNRFPYLFEEENVIDCSEWGCNEGGYMSWWFHHLPHFTGKGEDGVLFNWWPYIIDYEEGLDEAAATSFCQCLKCPQNPPVVASQIEFPANGLKQAGSYGGKLFSISISPTLAQDKITMVVSSSVAEDIHFKIFNAVGQLMLERSTTTEAAQKEILDVTDFPSGSYYLVASSKTETKVARFIVAKSN